MNITHAMIGGTGVYHAGDIEDAQTQTIHTPYGDAVVTIGRYAKRYVAFMARHGTHHGTPPHLINYRANLYALKSLGVQQVLATAAVGSLNLSYKPGELVLVDDVIDMTKSRKGTFFDEGRVVHVDVSDPYCARLRNNLKETAEALRIPLHDGGVYVCTEGPRFETKAEISMYAQLGGNVVGMTSMPETILAKELELCYATVCMVTNLAAGLSEHPLTHEEVTTTMAANVEKIRELFYHFILNDVDTRTCACPSAVGGQSALVGEGTA